MKSTDPSKGPSGKRYSDAFKQEALALIDAGRSQSQVSRDLGVSIWTLGEWRRRALTRKPGSTPAKPKPIPPRPTKRSRPPSPIA